MATRHQRGLARLMVAPSVLLLLAWMIVPLAMTLWFSFQSYNLLSPGTEQFIGLMNSGQACVAQTRILVSRRRHDDPARPGASGGGHRHP